MFQGRVAAHLRANVIGYLALFVALSGTAFAAGLAKNSVKSKHIKNGQVRTADLAPTAVKGSRVAPDSLTGEDIAEGTLGQVPSAATAANAATAATAATAGDANTLDSLDSSSFVQAGEPDSVTPAMLVGAPRARVAGPREPGCAQGQLIGNGNEEPLAFEIEDFDSGGMHAGCNPGVLSMEAGVYLVTASIVWPDTDTDGRRSLALLKNGTQYIAQEAYPAAAGQHTLQSVSTVIEVGLGDRVEAWAHQDSGSNLQLDHIDERNNLTLTWLGPPL